MKLSHNITDLFDNHPEIMELDPFNPAVSLAYSPAFRIAGCLFDLHTEEDPKRIEALEQQCETSRTWLGYLATQFADHQSVIDFVINNACQPKPRDITPTTAELKVMRDLGYSPAAIQAKKAADELKAKAFAEAQTIARKFYVEEVKNNLTACFKIHVPELAIQEWWNNLSNDAATGIIGNLGLKISNIPSTPQDKPGKIQSHSINEATQRGYAQTSADPYKTAIYIKRADTHARLVTLYEDMLEDVNHLFNVLISENGSGIGIPEQQTEQALSEIDSTTH